jgi:hypothetical protein
VLLTILITLIGQGGDARAARPILKVPVETDLGGRAPEGARGDAHRRDPRLDAFCNDKSCPIDVYR